MDYQKRSSPARDEPRNRFVEMEGVEPSSKQGNHTLSTRLSRPWFSCCGKTRATNHSLILKIFAYNARPLPTIPDIAAPLNQKASEKGHLSNVSFCHLVAELSQ